MRSIRLVNVCKSYHREVVLDHVSLTIPSGKFFALLGPSGSGKTTILRLIGGFERVDSGRIYLGNEDITYRPVNQRRVNTVFQSYALFPHLTVFENVAYSQRIKRVPAAQIDERVMRILMTMHLENHAHKSISQLSGGQQQRVALARAIINEPDVLLLDEPLAALDLSMRERMLLELIELQDKLKTTFVYVTHDQAEALTVADQMAIMNDDGEIEQQGTPKEIYEFPASAFVARFVGSTNIMQGIYRDDSPSDPRLEVPGIGMIALDTQRTPHKRGAGQPLMLSIRPEKIYITLDGARQDFSNRLSGTVESIVYHGRSTQYWVRVPSGDRLQVFAQNDEHFPHEVIDYDSTVYLYWQRENGVVLER